MAEYSSLNIAFIIIINNIIIMLLKNKILRREEKGIYIKFSLWRRRGTLPVIESNYFKIKNGSVITLIIKNIKSNNIATIKENQIRKRKKNKIIKNDIIINLIK